MIKKKCYYIWPYLTITLFNYFIGSFADKSKNNFNGLRKKLYISRLKTQNKPLFLKRGISKCFQSRTTPAKKSQRFKSSHVSSSDGFSTAGNPEKLPVCRTNACCFVARIDRIDNSYVLDRRDRPYTEVASVNSGNQLRVESINSIVNKFALLSLDIYRNNGKISTTNINLIVEKIKQILEYERENSVENKKISSSKKTISFIKKILHSTRAHVPKSTVSRKKPLKKYFIERQLQVPWSKTKSFYLSNTIINKANKSRGKKSILVSKSSKFTSCVSNNEISLGEAATKIPLKNNHIKSRYDATCSKNTRFGYQHFKAHSPIKNRGSSRMNWEVSQN